MFLKAGAVSRTNKNLARIPVQQSSMMLYYNIYILLSSIFLPEYQFRHYLFFSC
jgi:hypothetical protein